MIKPGIRFAKLEALGNDFMLIDARDGETPPPSDSVERLADRHRGVGFDQMLVLHPGPAGRLTRVEIINADGSRAEQCGNGMRAIAAWLAGRGELDSPGVLDTAAGPVEISRVGGDRYRAVLPGPETISPDALGLPPPRLPTEFDGWRLVSMGNPHLVVWRDAAPDADALAGLVAALDDQADWSRRVNIGLARLADGEIELRVHERGAGATQACGSGACAVVAALAGSDRKPAHVRQPGGTLVIDLDSQRGRAITTGPAHTIFEGRTT